MAVSVYNQLVSRPSRARGLKHLSRIIKNEPQVASFTGAWIETFKTVT